jgi:hypothetical protein
MADECVMNACSGPSGPRQRVLQAIIAPEKLAVTNERRSAEDAARLRLGRLLLEARLDVSLRDARQKPLRIKV